MTVGGRLIEVMWLFATAKSRSGTGNLWCRMPLRVTRLGLLRKTEAILPH